LHIVLIVSWAAVGGCAPADPVAHFITEVDASPPEKRPPDWERTKRLMSRPAPAVGQPAPDFTLASADGRLSITRSKFHVGRPLVLIFGSFT
jgi:hypothetical protein